MKLFYHIAAELSHDTASTLSRRAIHSTRKSTALRCCADESGRCRGTFHHFSMQPRQHIADPCIALKTGCPRMGVCRPSFFGSAGASFIRTKSSACRRTVSRPTRAMYARSAAVNSNRERNFDLPSRTNASAFVMPLFYHNSAPRLQAARNAQDRFLCHAAFRMRNEMRIRLPAQSCAFVANCRASIAVPLHQLPHFLSKRLRRLDARPKNCRGVDVYLGLVSSAGIPSADCPLRPRHFCRGLGARNLVPNFTKAALQLLRPLLHRQPTAPSNIQSNKLMTAQSYHHFIPRIPCPHVLQPPHLVQHVRVKWVHWNHLLYHRYYISGVRPLRSHLRSQLATA